MLWCWCNLIFPFICVAIDPPEWYKPTKDVLKEHHCNTTDYPENTPVYTSLPPVPLTATLENSPDGWTECLFLGPAAKCIILSTPGFPQPVPKPDRVSHIVGKSKTADLGLTAARNLKAGDLVYAERPILMAFQNSKVPRVPPGTTKEQLVYVVLQEWERQLRPAFERLEPEKQAAYRKLANSHTEDGSGPILGIMRTNSFGVDLDPNLSDEGKVSVVCEVLSRVNHRCAFCQFVSNFRLI